MIPVFKIPFYSTTTNLLETAGLDKMLRIFVVSIGMSQMLPLILESLSFPCIIAFFFNKILFQIKTFSNFSNFSTHLV